MTSRSTHPDDGKGIIAQLFWIIFAAVSATDLSGSATAPLTMTIGGTDATQAPADVGYLTAQPEDGGGWLARGNRWSVESYQASGEGYRTGDHSPARRRGFASLAVGRGGGVLHRGGRRGAGYRA